MEGFCNGYYSEQAAIRFAALNYTYKVSVYLGHLCKFLLREFAAEADFSDLLAEHKQGGMSHGNEL